VPRPVPARDHADRCPGVLSLAPAADGGLARVRLPGGLISPDGLRLLSRACAELGNGTLELTSRANVQIRGVQPASEAALESMLADSGLLPSRTHERVRNIVASPLSDLSRIVVALDSALCARPRLAELSGRFLFGIDDGSGDIAALRPDVLGLVSRDGAWVEGAPVPHDEVVSAMLARAEAFLEARDAAGGTAWRFADLEAGRVVIASRPVQPPSPPPAGVVTMDAGASLVVLAPLGRLAAEQAYALAAVAGPDGLKITPWRSVVVVAPPSVDRAVRVAAEAGLGVGADSPWYQVSACAGQPGCAKSLADVQADARAWALGTRDRPGPSVHWSGCERRCGRPIDAAVDFVAHGEGYDRIDSTGSA